MAGMFYFSKTECSDLGKGYMKKSVSCQYDSNDELIIKRGTIDIFIVLKFNCY